MTFQKRIGSENDRQRDHGTPIGMKSRIRIHFPQYLTIEVRCKDQNWCWELNPWSRLDHTEGLVFDHVIVGAAITPLS